MEMPVLLTKSAYFNFLREYWLACNKEDKPPQVLVTEASLAWQDLEPNEKSLYEESTYIGARLAHDLYNEPKPKSPSTSTRKRKTPAKAPPTRSNKIRPSKCPTPSKIRARTRNKRRAH